jgi:hypothetical protein
MKNIVTRQLRSRVKDLLRNPAPLQWRLWLAGQGRTIRRGGILFLPHGGTEASFTSGGGMHQEVIG